MDNKYNKIRNQRKELTYSTRELAELSNIKEKDLLDYETNKKKASLKTIEKIANATGTKVQDWVEEEYFMKKRNDEKVSSQGAVEITDKIPCDNAAEAGATFFSALLQGDNVMNTVYDALITMQEATLNQDGKVELSAFAEELCKSIAQIKLKKVMSLYIKEKKEEDSSENIIKKIEISKRKERMKNISINELIIGFKEIFKDTDTMDVILKALINTNYINSQGYHSGKVDLIINAIMSNKINNLTNSEC